MAKGVFTDPRDGKSYPTVEVNGQIWLAKNLDFALEGESFIYENDPHLAEKYGRLYTWEGAQKACPPGWRLPTDTEWKALAKAFGGYHDSEKEEDDGDPKKALNALFEGGESGFNALMGGWRYSHTKEFYDMGTGGGYWSRDKKDDQYVWNFYFDGFNGYLARRAYNKMDANSCRCIKDS